MNFFVLFFVLKLFEVGQSKLSSQYCSLENQSVGRCIPTSFCPQTVNLTSPNLRRTCEAGSVCCRVSANIVTPTNAAPMPAAPAPAAPVGAPAPAGSAPPAAAPAPPPAAPAPPAAAPAPGAAPPAAAPPTTAKPPAAAPPSGAAPPAVPAAPSAAAPAPSAAAPAPPAAVPAPSAAAPAPPAAAPAPPAAAPAPGAAPPAAAPPTTAKPPAAAPPSGAAPPAVPAAPPAAAPPTTAKPPAAAPPTTAKPPAAAPPSGAAPPAGAPPNGAAPPGGALPGGVRPSLIGNIVADPALTSNILSPLDDTVVVSAEVISNAIDIFDKKCDLYHPVVPTTKQLPQNPPIVMIYGGTNTAEKEFPHMTALGYGSSNAKQWLCAGSLITENYVLTAAHCLSAPPLGEVKYVKLGNIRLDQDTQNTQQFNVVSRVPHPQYDSQANYNDIALLRLDQSVQMTEYVRPICLFSSTNYEDRNLIATGWGKTESGTVSMDLRKVGLELFGQTECQSAYSAVPKQQLPLGIQEASQMCAGSRSPGKDTCQGDSGGPLQIRKNNRWYLVGITSMGIQCGNAKYPGVYSRVAYYLEWIQQNMSNK